MEPLCDIGPPCPARATAATKTKQSIGSAFPRRRKKSFANHDCFHFGLNILELDSCNRVAHRCHSGTHPGTGPCARALPEPAARAQPVPGPAPLQDARFELEAPGEEGRDARGHPPLHQTDNPADEKIPLYQDDVPHYLYDAAQQLSSSPPQQGDPDPDSPEEDYPNHGLQPMVDVFDDLVDVGEPFDDETSANAPAGDHLAEIAEEATHNEKRDNLDAELSEEDQISFENKGQKASTLAPSSPTGPPPRLTGRQRARLNQLLQERDDLGNVPLGLDAYDTDVSGKHSERVFFLLFHYFCFP